LLLLLLLCRWLLPLLSAGSGACRKLLRQGLQLTGAWWSLLLYRHGVLQLPHSTVSHGMQLLHLL
jgi:hypothetical protein